MGLRTGLLYKAENLSKSDCSYISFLRKHNIDCIFELKFYSYYYFCSKSYGLDASTILQTKSTKSFWEGIIPSCRKIYNFKKDDNSIAPFRQFFSFELKDSIDLVSVYQYDNETILLLCNQPLTDEIINDFPISTTESNLHLSQIQDQINENSILNLFSIDFSECVENISEEKLKNNENLKIEYENVLLNELFTKLQFYFSDPSAVIQTSRTAANILFVSKTAISEDLIVTQLIKLFSKVIGASSELINFNFLGKTRSITEIKEFLKVI